MRVSADNSHRNNYILIQKAVQEVDLYESVMLNALLNIGCAHKLRTQHYRFMFHFKRPSQGPHKAVHCL